MFCARTFPRTSLSLALCLAAAPFTGCSTSEDDPLGGSTDGGATESGSGGGTGTASGGATTSGASTSASTGSGTSEGGTSGTSSASEGTSGSTTDASTGTATGDPTTGTTDGTTTATTDASTTDASGTATTTGGTDTDTETDTGGCQAWRITYDLTGSEFEVSDTPLGAGDQRNVLEEPYDGDATFGPGELTLVFQDVGGAPGGQVAFTDYAVSLNFVVRGATTVTTNLEQSAGPNACGVTTGTLAGDEVAWTPSAIVGHSSIGQVLCQGALCTLGGLPNGTPVPQNEMGDQPLSNFTFAGDLTSFTMPRTVIQMDQNSTISWTYAGTEVSREAIAAPACLCP
jgi:hypothetical protein